LALEDGVTEILEELVSLLGIGEVTFSKFERVSQKVLQV